MPNEKVRYFKEPDEIKEKIIYVKDKDLIGFDSSSSLVFQFRYWKMKDFNISDNFICMNDDYLFYNSSSNGNINSNNNYNNYIFNEYLNNDIKSFGGKEPDFFNKRKYSLSEMNINIKDLKEPNGNSDDIDLDYNLNYNLFNNNLNLNANQENKITINKLFDNNDEKIGYRQQFNNQDFIFNQQSSRKMSLEENVNN